MRIAYLINWELSSNDGVSKKVYAQTHEWQNLGNEVTVFCIARTLLSEFGSVPIKVIEKKKSDNVIQEYINVYNAYNKVFPIIKAFNPSIIYFRFDLYQPALKKILKAFPSVIEMNSNDNQELRLLGKKNLKGKIRFAYHQVVRNNFLKLVDGFCCVTDEIAHLPSITKFNKPIFVVPNAIKLESYFQPPVTNQKSELVPRLIFIGTPNQSWHGLDKIIELAKATEGKLQFNIIGMEREHEQTYSSNIYFYGYLQKNEYEKLMRESDIGVCTLALHRKNMEEASPLKTREYLAFGLPIIVGYKDTAFLNSDLPDWVLQLPNSEDNVVSNINLIIEFCYKNFGRKLLNGEAYNYIDSKIFEKKRVECLKKILNKINV